MLVSKPILALGDTRPRSGPADGVARTGGVEEAGIRGSTVSPKAMKNMAVRVSGAVLRASPLSHHPTHIICTFFDI